MKRILLIFALTAFIACKSDKKENAANEKVDTQLNELYALMQGSFNSAKQAEADSTYYNISLHMYPIWEGQGNYLYVEQALNEMQERPYRQRIYEVKRINDSVLSSAVYTIPNDSLWIGKWKTPKAFDSIAPSDLKIREGCAVLLQRTGDKSFKGATSENACGSTLRGATYAASKVEITANKIESWDQGFDAEGNQVWGAEKGGYIFDKL